MDLNEANVFQILSAGSFLQLNAVCDLCSEYLSKNLSAENCIQINRYSKDLAIKTLENSSYSYMLDNFEILAKNLNFLNDLTELEISNLFLNENLNVSTEEVVYEALLSWIDLNTQERLKSLPKLLSKVKLPLLDASYLTKEIETNELLSKYSECQSLMLEATIYHINPDKFQAAPIYRTIPRKSTQGYLICFGGIDPKSKSNNSYFMEKYDYRTEKWTQIKFRINHNNNSNPNFVPNITKRSRFATAYFGNNLYVVGGCEGGESIKTLNTVECFDLNKQSWTLVTPHMLSRRHGHQATFLNQEPILYAIGGHDGRHFLNSVERHEPLKK
jgi:hypothetical protein